MTDHAAIPRSAPESADPLPDRDEAQVGEIALITDRGLAHHRNEDAAAAGTVTTGSGRPGIAIAVCDGVSSSTDAHLAAVAASKAGVDAMLTTLASGEADDAVFAGLTAAARAAAMLGTSGRLEMAPSCTYTAAAVVPNADGAVEIVVGNVGDSRAFWFPESSEAPRQLTLDDSLARELIAAGLPEDSAAVQRGAHTLTRWLGADNDAQPWAESSVSTFTMTGAGVLLLCTDGLWNYLPDAADLVPFVDAADPAATARALTDYAVTAGGQDNITVVVTPIRMP
ncbi:PP2C family protein-serine/threonine phosphatase [Mycolicibacterium komossense]|nr:protein phosphatase 2C domain-containing protein [Mycolicibacterium komossense]